VQADCRVGAVVGHVVHVVGSEGPDPARGEGAMHQRRRAARAGRWEGRLLDHPGQDGERTGRAAVVVQAGRLPGQPGEQPGLVVVGPGDPHGPPAVMGEPDVRAPQVGAGGELAGQVVQPCGADPAEPWRRGQEVGNGTGKRHGGSSGRAGEGGGGSAAATGGAHRAHQVQVGTPAQPHRGVHLSRRHVEKYVSRETSHQARGRSRRVAGPAFLATGYWTVKDFVRSAVDESPAYTSI
jgi:hypothetical protein